MTIRLNEPRQKNDTIANFVFALRSPESKRQYPRRLKMFFDFEFDNTLSLEEQANLFLKKANSIKDGIRMIKPLKLIPKSLMP